MWIYLRMGPTVCGMWEKRRNQGDSPDLEPEPLQECTCHWQRM